MKYLFLVLFIIFATSTSYAAEAKRTAINLIMDKSGIERQISQVPDQLMQSIQQRAAQSTTSNGPSIVFASLAESIKHAYKLDTMKENISNILYNNLTDEEVVYILEWFGSDIGQKITEEEVLSGEKSTTPAGMADISAFMQSLNIAPAKEDRLYMIQNLDEAIHATDFMVNTTLNTSMAFMKAMQKTIPSSQESSNNAGIEKQLQTQKTTLKPVFKEIVEKTLLYTYKDITNEELSSYVNFCKSPSGRKFYQTSFQAIGMVLSNANTEMANYFASKIQLNTPPPVSTYKVPNMVPMPPIN